MKNINKLISKLILEIGLMVILFLFSFVVFKKIDVSYVTEHGNYTNVEVLNVNDKVGLNDFLVDEQVVLNVYNDSNTLEYYNVYLTSKEDLSFLDNYLKIKINNQEYLLSDLKVWDNCYLLDTGNIVANNKYLKLYFAIDEKHSDLISNLNLNFYNDSTIV